MVIFDRINFIIFLAAIFGKFSSGLLYKNETSIEKPVSDHNNLSTKIKINHSELLLHQSNFKDQLKPDCFEVDLNNTTDKNTSEHEVQPQGIITPIDFYERIMQHLEEQKLSPKDLIGPTEVFMRAMMMYDKLYEAYNVEVSPSNASLMVTINPEEIPTCENFYNNLTSFVKTEYQVTDQNQPIKLVMKARKMYDSMYGIYKRCLSSKNSLNITEVEKSL